MKKKAKKKMKKSKMIKNLRIKVCKIVSKCLLRIQLQTQWLAVRTEQKRVEIKLYREKVVLLQMAMVFKMKLQIEKIIFNQSLQMSLISKMAFLASLLVLMSAKK